MFQNDCLDSNGTGATINDFGYSNITLIFNLNESETLDVNYTFKFNSEIIQFNETYEFEFETNNDDKGTFIIFIFLFAFLCIVLSLKIVLSKKKKKI